MTDACPTPRRAGSPGADAEDAAVAFGLVRRADGLERIVGELHGRAAVGGDHLADDGEGVEPAVGPQPAEVVGEQGAPAVADAHAPREVAVDVLDGLHVQAIGEDDELVGGVLPAPLPPVDGQLAAGDGIAGIDAHACPVRDPVRRALQEAGRTVGVGQHDAQVAVVVGLPVGQHLVGRLGQLAVVLGQRAVDHRQLVRIGADRLHLVAHGDQAVGGAEEGRAEPLHHRLHAPVLPQEAMPPPGAEVGDAHAGELLEPADLLPQARHGARVEHLQLELGHAFGDGPGVQLHQHGERRDLPHGGLDPGAIEGQLVLVSLALELVGREAEALEPGEEVGPEHRPLAVEAVAAQPGRLAAGKRERADVIELLLQLAHVDEPGKLHRHGAVDDAEGDTRVPVPPEDRLRHQQLVEIGVDHRAHDRVDLPGVVVDAGGDVGHGAEPRQRESVLALVALSRREIKGRARGGSVASRGTGAAMRMASARGRLRGSPPSGGLGQAARALGPGSRTRPHPEPVDGRTEWHGQGQRGSTQAHHAGRVLGPGYSLREFRDDRD